MAENFAWDVDSLFRFQMDAGVYHTLGQPALHDEITG
jgi:hypothetical protein